MSDPSTDGTDGRSEDGTLPLISDHIIGNYQLVLPIGSGAMGEVYLARHRQFKDRQYAIKLIRRGMISKEARTRFEREILAMGDLAHPNLVYANDAGMDGDRMYLVMEYVPGEELQCMIDQHGRFRVTYAAEIIRQICVGIAHAHGRGVVHRDIKPANVMVSDQMQVKVLDLGIASLQNDAAARMTTAQSVMGTAPFISPELWEGATNATPASDVYAIGCTAYCLLTGEPPFAGEKYQSLTSVMLAHRETVPIPLRTLRKDIPPELNKILERTLEKNPDKRLNDAAELSQLLVPFCEPLPRDTTKLYGAIDRIDLPSIRPHEDAKADSQEKSKSKLAGVAFTLVTLSILAIATTFVFQSFSKNTVDPPTKLNPPVADQTWIPAGCQKSPDATVVTVEYGGLKERLWSEVQLVPLISNESSADQPLDMDPIQFVLVPQSGTGSPMSFYIMKNKVSVGQFAAFEASYPELVDPEAKRKRDEYRQSVNPSSPAFWVTGKEATEFAMRMCGGKLPKPNQWDTAFGRGFRQSDFEKWISADESYIQSVLNKSSTELDISRWGCIDMGSVGMEFTRFLETDDIPTQLRTDGQAGDTELPERDLRGQSPFSSGGILQIDEWAQSEMLESVYFGASPINVASADIGFRVVLDKDEQ